MLLDEAIKKPDSFDEPGVTPLVLHGDCPNKANHTPCPEGYIQWHDWAAKMSKTHSQIRCQGCGKWVTWLPKAKARKKGKANE